LLFALNINSCSKNLRNQSQGKGLFPMTGNKKNLLLIADKDKTSQKMLSLFLDEAEYKLIDCCEGKQAVRLCASLSPDLMLLDPDLPDMNGVQLIKAVREWSQVPIIIISDKTDNESVISCLNEGASDYVFKPFNADVLKARINAALRSSAVNETGEPELVNGMLRIDLVRHEVFLNNKPVSFTPKEYNLLRFFIIHRGKMLTHREILKEVWGDAHAQDTQYLRVFVGQIREKIEINPQKPTQIITEPGIGYRMEIAEIASLHEQGKLRLCD
jgi:two-component system, OmpR family, KDP operon response regulator KdpE